MSNSCECVERHVPLPVTLRTLQVGPDVVYLCPTTYYNIRDLLTEFEVRSTVPPGSVTKHYSKFVREIVLALWKESKDM